MNKRARQPMAPHIRKKLETDGVILGRYTRKPAPGVCPHCNAKIAIALGDFLAHTLIAIHPTPTTPEGEWRTLAAGHHTYWTPEGRLDTRHAWEITAHPATTTRVYPTHICRVRPPPHPHFPPLFTTTRHRSVGPPPF